MKKTSLAVLFLTVFIDLIGFGMVIPFLSFYAREYGASGTTVGMVVGVYSIMQFFFAPVWGRLSDRIGRRPVILISLTASCIGYFLFAFSRSLTLLFLSRIVAGAGGANIGTAQAYIADKTTTENRAKGMGIIGAAFGMGFILGPPLSGILSHVGTKHGMAGNLLPGVVAGSLSLIALTIAFFVLGESKPPDLRPRSGIPPQFDKRVWSWMASHGLVLAIISTTLITLLAVAGMETSVTLHARDRFHFTQLQMSWFFLFMGLIVAVIQGGLIGKLAKRFGEKTLIATGTASFTIGLALVPLVWRVPLLYGVVFFIAVGQGLTYPSLTSLLTKATPSSEHGSMLGLASGLGSLARFIGPILVGFLYDLAQARGAFYGSAVITAIAFVLALRMRKQPLTMETSG
ncbi:MAG: transporter, family, tetracycline resistance protein [Thermoanaerobaculia bacterium]|jgi:MFS family permease|nr:transporter, family, tetracycline resistance protein [Thermoanaerobaculia bacterium]